MKFIFIKNVCYAEVECICKAMLDSPNLLDGTFAKQFVMVLFQSVVNFAVGCKKTKVVKAW